MSETVTLTLDEAYAAQNWEVLAGDYVMLAVSENESRQLALIDEAIQRVDDKEYGECQNCGKEVNPKRLAAIPWARYCIDCQELVEQGMLDEATV